MLERLCGVCGCESDSVSYYFDEAIDKVRVGVVLAAEVVLNECITKALSGSVCYTEKASTCVVTHTLRTTKTNWNWLTT